MNTTCMAVVDVVPGPFGFEPVLCKRPGAHSFVSTSGLRILFCGIVDHERTLRRRFMEREPLPEWPSDMTYARLRGDA